MMGTLCLLLDPPADGAWNMAVDETLLESAAATGQATLRFYRWEVPTLSLGYFQSLADRAQHPPSRDCPAVRRATGGGAILHDRELTYSIALPQPRHSTDAVSLYDTCHQTLIATLAAFGVAATLYRDSSSCGNPPQPAQAPFLCFLRRTCSDIVFEDTKIVGSAQRRRRGAVLQHGSILLACSPFAPELMGIAELANRTIHPAELAERWTPRMAAELGVTLDKRVLSPAEFDRAKTLSHTRFASADYLSRR